MLRSSIIAIGLAAGLTWGLGEVARAQSCTAYPNALTNGTTADASHVMANFNCAALTGNGLFTGNVGIGTVSPAAPLHVVGTVDPLSIFDAYAGSSNLRWRRADGSQASPTALVAGDVIGNMAFFGYNGSTFTVTASAAIKSIADDNFTATANGADGVRLGWPLLRPKQGRK